MLNEVSINSDNSSNEWCEYEKEFGLNFNVQSNHIVANSEYKINGGLLVIRYIIYCNESSRMIYFVYTTLPIAGCYGLHFACFYLFIYLLITGKK